MSLEKFERSSLKDKILRIEEERKRKELERVAAEEIIEVKKDKKSKK